MEFAKKSRLKSKKGCGISGEREQVQINYSKS